MHMILIFKHTGNGLLEQDNVLHKQRNLFRISSPVYMDKLNFKAYNKHSMLAFSFLNLAKCLIAISKLNL